MTAPIDTVLFCGSFFGYAAEICKSLNARGRNTVLFDDRPTTNSMAKAVIRLAPSLMQAKAERYFDDVIEQLRGQPVRDVLAIKGESLSAASIQRMRAAFPNALFTLYFWDSYRNMPADSREKSAAFDRVFSFDPQDVRNDPRMIYRPLFFMQSLAHLPDLPKDIDVLFFGTMHGDRFTVLRRLSRSLPTTLRMIVVLYFPAKWLFAAHALRDPEMLWADQRWFVYSPKSRADLADLIARARVVVDIERPIQSGYTMRTVETLGASRKLITTNKEVARADFYDPANVAIIDRDHPWVSPDFLTTPYRPVASEVRYRYSLSGWLDEVLPVS